MSTHSYQKDGKTFYRIIFRVNGKQKQRRGYKTKIEAKRAERELLTLADKETAVTNPRLTLGEYLRKWFDGVEGTRDIGKSQKQRIAQHLEHIISNIGELKVKALDKSDVIELRNKLQLKLAPRTIKQMEIILKAALADGVEDNLLTRNPLQRFKTNSIPFHDKKKVEPFQPNEQALLLKAARDYADKHDPRWFILVYLALHTGMRRGELFALQWRHINLEKGFITVEQSMEYSNGEAHGKLKGPKSQAGNRTIYITTKCREEIKRYQLWAKETGFKFRKSVGDNDFVLFKDDFEPLNKSAFRSRWQTILKTSGINLLSPNGEPRRLHDLRHTHASNMIFAGLNIKLLQERMGHSTASITLDVYGHIFKSEGEAQYLDALTKWEAAL